ncbi:unnamed protein product [Tilletia controversa]|nr:unnamed protein product [Tilletia controversa]
MASALASQLAGIRSVNAARIATLGSSAGTQHTVSYLFPPKTAAAQDLNTVHALARTGLEDLAAHDRWFESSSAWAPDDVSRSGRELLFGDSGKSRDRSVLTKEDNTLMDEALALFLAASLMVIAALGACFPFSSEAVRATIGSLVTRLSGLSGFPSCRRAGHHASDLRPQDSSDWQGRSSRDYHSSAYRTLALPHPARPGDPELVRGLVSGCAASFGFVRGECPSISNVRRVGGGRRRPRRIYADPSQVIAALGAKQATEA